MQPGLSDIVRDALVKARIFGAAFIYVGADDGQSQEAPLWIKKVKGVRFLNVLTTKELSHQTFYNDPAHEKYGHCGSAMALAIAIILQRIYPSGALTKHHQTSAGIKKYRWQTSQDERVRDSHRDRNDNVYSWDKPGPHPRAKSIVGVMRCRF